MRAYVIEELYIKDIRRVEQALDERGLRGGLEGIYYLPVDEKYLSEEQQAHLAECGSYFLALETVVPYEGEQGYLKLELLVRARNKLRCSCVAYASTELRGVMMDYVDDFLRELDISV